MDFNKTTLIDNVLKIENEDGTATFISEERCEFDNDAKNLFEEFRKKYPEGKPKPEVPIQEPEPTTEEQLIATQNQLVEAKSQLDNVSLDFNNFMAYAFEKIPSLSE